MSIKSSAGEEGKSAYVMAEKEAIPLICLVGAYLMGYKSVFMDLSEIHIHNCI